MELCKKSIVSSIVHLVFPSKCLHCGQLLYPQSSTLCGACSQQLNICQGDGRCSACFDFLDEDGCESCAEAPSLFIKMGAAFDYEGVAASLVKSLKYGNRPHLAKGMAAFLVAQLHRLEWPLPDALVPIPISLSRSIQRGYNQSALLAEAMGQFINRPVWPLLKRYEGNFSQAALNFYDRKQLKQNRFHLKSQQLDFKNKRLLLIDDVTTTGVTLQQCAEALLQSTPASLYALTFCKTMDML